MDQKPITKHIFDLEDRTLRFAKEIIAPCNKIEHTFINKEVLIQLIRPSGSIGANYREANDTPSKKDFAYRIGITLRETKESHYWLELLIAANPGLINEISILVDETIELKKIFSAILNKTR